MQFKVPKNDQRFIWTKHVIEKMRYYRLSQSRIKHLIKHYDRKEQGIAPNTIALGRRIGSKRPTEIWLMYQPVKKKVCPNPALFKKELDFSGQVKIISAWRYPGISPKRGGAPIPEDIKDFFENYKLEAQ